MVEYHFRCSHCLVVYSYQASGYNCQRSENDPKYCPDCKKVIDEALSNVPKKIERMLSDVDIPLQDLLDNEARIKREVEATGGLYCQRITPGLYDMKDPDNRNITGVTTMGGVTYYYSYWTKKDDVTVRQEMELNVETQEEVPWRDYKDPYK